MADVMTAVAPQRKRTRANGAPDGAKTEPAALQHVHNAAAPSPLPPIADYAFLSDCHPGALVAPDGSVDWLRVRAQ